MFIALFIHKYFGWTGGWLDRWIDTLENILCCLQKNWEQKISHLKATGKCWEVFMCPSHPRWTQRGVWLWWAEMVYAEVIKKKKERKLPESMCSCGVLCVCVFSVVREENHICNSRTTLCSCLDLEQLLNSPTPLRKANLNASSMSFHDSAVH